MTRSVRIAKNIIAVPTHEIPEYLDVYDITFPDYKQYSEPGESYIQFIERIRNRHNKQTSLKQQEQTQELSDQKCEQETGHTCSPEEMRKIEQEEIQRAQHELGIKPTPSFTPTSKPRLIDEMTIEEIAPRYEQIRQKKVQNPLYNLTPQELAIFKRYIQLEKIQNLQEREKELIEQAKPSEVKDWWKFFGMKRLMLQHISNAPNMNPDDVYIELERLIRKSKNSTEKNELNELRNAMIEYTGDTFTASIRTSIVKKEGNEWVVRSKKGKNLGKYKTKSEALKRLRQVEYFKHKKSSLVKNIIAYEPSEYFNAFLGSLPANAFITLIQGVGEAVADTIRVFTSMGGKTPGQALVKPPKALLSGLWNFIKNIGRVFYRSHEVAMGRKEISTVVSDAWNQFKDRVRLIGQSLRDEQSKQQLKQSIQQAVQSNLTNAPTQIQSQLSNDLTQGM